MKSKKLKNSKGEPLELSYNNLVIGSSLEALLFAYYNRYPIVWTQNLAPLPFEELKEDFGLGKNAYAIWSHHAFLMGLAGFIPFGDTINNIYILDDSKLRLVSKEDYVYKITYGFLHVFDDNNLVTPDEPEMKLVDLYKVIDWFKPASMSTNLLKSFYYRDDPFFREIYVYKGSAYGKHICSFSYCTEKELEKDIFPVYLASIRMEQYVIKETGIKKTTSKICHYDRKILNLSKKLYRDRENVKFYSITARMIYEVSRSQKLDYITYIKDRLEI